MSTESDIAGRIARKGLAIIDKLLDELANVPRDDWGKTHVRDVTDCVMAAVKVQSEERAQLEFEAEHKLGVDDLRKLLKDYLSALPPAEFQTLIAESARKEQQPHA